MKDLKLKTNLPILLLISVVTCYLILKDSFSDIIYILKETNYFILFIALIILLISDYFKSLSLYYISKSNSNNLSKKDAFSLILETNFFNGVTPFALGGQPFQLFLLKKKNKINYVDGTNIIYCDYCVYQLTLITLVLILFLINKIFNFVTLTPIMNIFLLIGFMVHFVLFLVVVFITTETKKDDKFVYSIIHLLHKVKLVKDEKKLKEKISYLKKLIKNFRKNRKLVFITCACNALKLILYGLIPWVCFKATGLNVDIMTSIICSVFIWTIASFIPIPGATGGMEYSFITMFTVVLYESAAKSVAFLWRFLTYYLMIIVGAIIFVVVNSKIKNTDE